MKYVEELMVWFEKQPEFETTAKLFKAWIVPTLQQQERLGQTLHEDLSKAQKKKDSIQRSRHSRNQEVESIHIEGSEEA
jgi:hypothetical protein